MTRSDTPGSLPVPPGVEGATTLFVFGGIILGFDEFIWLAYCWEHSKDLRSAA